MTVRTDTLIIGAGQAGLALSRHLTELGRDHLLLERGRVAERWRSERWDSLTLLTPNWQTRLPGYRYQGPDPDGFMTRDELVGFLDAYAASFDAPVVSGVTVTAVEPAEDGGWLASTDQGGYAASQVVVATGHAGRPHLPEVAGRLHPRLTQLHSSQYRNPGQLPPGGVLVVGAAASGQQIASELQRAGRRVVLAVGRHTKLPRRYRGHDIFWWLDASGKLSETTDQVPDLEAARRAPSFALTGRGGGEDLDLYAMASAGMILAGRMEDADGTRVRFRHDVAATLAEADEKMRRVLREVDRFAARAGIAASDEAPPPAPRWTQPPLRTLDLDAHGINTVVWATGFRRDFGFLRAPVLRPDGEPIHHRGVTPLPGLAFLGLRWQHTRKSNFIDGVGDDAAYLAERIAATRSLQLTA